MNQYQEYSDPLYSKKFKTREEAQQVAQSLDTEYDFLRLIYYGNKTDEEIQKFENFEDQQKKIGPYNIAIERYGPQPASEDGPRNAGSFTVSIGDEKEDVWDDPLVYQEFDNDEMQNAIDYYNFLNSEVIIKAEIDEKSDF